jgi:hypothetical protein
MGNFLADLGRIFFTIHRTDKDVKLWLQNYKTISAQIYERFFAG